MNYYPHHIGDFNSATRLWSRLQRSIYRDMLDWYYHSEAPLPLDKERLVCKIAGPQASAEETAAIDQILAEFFYWTDAGWANSRCDWEIAQYHAGIERSKAGGKAKAARAAQAAIQAAAQQAGAAAPQQRAEVEQLRQECAQLRAACEQLRAAAQHCQPEPKPEPKPKPEAEPNPAQPTLSIVPAREASAVQLSIALRKAGVQSQPANPQLLAMAEQGVSVATIEAACAEARRSKGEVPVKLGYVVAIVQRWAQEAAALRVAGAQQPARAPGSTAGGESVRDRERRETLEGLTGRRSHGPRTTIIDINPLAG